MKIHGSPHLRRPFCANAAYLRTKEESRDINWENVQNLQRCVILKKVTAI